MKLLYTLSLLTCSVTTLFAQEVLSEKFFTSAGRQVDNKTDSDYYLRVEQKDTTYLITYYDSADDLPSEQHYCSVFEPEVVKNGPSEFYHKDGTILKKGTYSNNEKVGRWEEFYTNGKPKSIYFYKDDSQNLVQMWSDNYKHTLVNGTGYAFQLSEDKAYNVYTEAIDSILLVCYQIQLSTSDTIYYVAPVTTMYSRGMEGFYKELASKMVYPKTARRRGIEGKVFVEFTIDKNGNPINVHTIKGIGGGCDEEAERAISLMKSWDPAEHDGKKVKQKLIIPVFFKLN